ncbi:MAG: VCBS repeat-containing protein, partial [Myxococcota bacterium]|nr:VCBS repeat-containing protein [Myxococcota bacterium]
KGVLRIIPGDGNRSGAAMLRADYVTDSSAYQVYPYRYSNVALGDIDSDGQPEIVFIAQVLEDSSPDTGEIILDTGPPDTAPPSEPGDSGGAGDTGEEAFPIDPVLPDPETPDGSSICQVVAIDPSGAVEWIAHDLLLTCGGHAPALGDLEGDGAVEVIVGDAAISGSDGALLWEGGAGKGAYATHPEVGYHTVISDLDGDGLQEVLTGRTLYSATGDVLCGFTDPERDGFAAVADLDLDGVGEVVSIGGGIGRIIEMDCSVVTTFSLAGGGNGGPPTIADYDTDGVPEIGVAEAETYTVYEADGTVSWSTRVDDASSHVTGSVVFDFEGDGRPEVVYADETRLWVFDGLTGAVRLEDTNHASRTLHEFPTVADVDGDGQTEINVPCGGGHAGENQNGLYVLGSETGAWVGSRQVWNQHAY